MRTNILSPSCALQDLEHGSKRSMRWRPSASLANKTQDKLGQESSCVPFLVQTKICARCVGGWLGLLAKKFELLPYQNHVWISHGCHLSFCPTKFMPGFLMTWCHLRMTSWQTHQTSPCSCQCPKSIGQPGGIFTAGPTTGLRSLRSTLGLWMMKLLNPCADAKHKGFVHFMECNQHPHGPKLEAVAFKSWTSKTKAQI